MLDSLPRAEKNKELLVLDAVSRLNEKLPASCNHGSTPSTLADRSKPTLSSQRNDFAGVEAVLRLSISVDV
jgi:hypothetical protein